MVADVVGAAAVAAPAGGLEEPVRYVGHDQADPNHEGGLRLAGYGYSPHFFAGPDAAGNLGPYSAIASATISSTSS